MFPPMELMEEEDLKTKRNLEAERAELNAKQPSGHFQRDAERVLRAAQKLSGVPQQEIEYKRQIGEIGFGLG